MSWMKWPQSTSEKHSRPCQTPWAELPGRSAKWVAPAKPKPIGTHFIYISSSYYDGYISLSSLSLLLYITFIIIIILIIITVSSLSSSSISIVINIIVPIFWGDERPFASYFHVVPGNWPRAKKRHLFVDTLQVVETLQGTPGNVVKRHVCVIKVGDFFGTSTNYMEVKITGKFMWLLVLKMPKYTSTITQSPDGKHLRGDNTTPFHR